MSSGDGWVDCRCGERHWGRHGAAGLLLVSGDGRVLLQQRAASQHAGTWALPGGARHREESAEDAAVREAAEEVGLDPGRVEVVDTSVDDHGNWSYTTVIATHRGVGDMRPVSETAAVRWVPIVVVEEYPLHPGFAAAWGQELHEQTATLLAADDASEKADDPDVRSREDAVTGWRFWWVDHRRRLQAARDLQLLQSNPWLNTTMRAVCIGRNVPDTPHPDEAPPVERCFCGIRVVQDPDGLLRYLRFSRHVRMHYAHISQIIPPMFENRAACEALTVPDAIGSVRGWGHCLPGRQDPVDTWRVERAELGGTLHLSAHLRQSAQEFAANYPTAQVVVGSKLGLAWLDEVERYQRKKWRPTKPPGVTYLGNMAQVNPQWAKRRESGPERYVAAWRAENEALGVRRNGTLTPAAVRDEMRAAGRYGVEVVVGASAATVQQTPLVPAIQGPMGIKWG